MNNFSAIILAAGQGKRMNSDISKVMHKISGKPLIDWVYTKLKEAGCENHVVVIGHKKEQIEEYFKDSVNYAIQDKMLGTGHAVMMCEDYFKGENKTVMVLCGDAPLISKELIEKTIKSHKESNASATVVSAIVNDATGYGRIIKDENENLLKIVEHKDATDEEKKVNEINSGMYCFESKDLFNALSKIKNDNAQGEYYLTDTIGILKSEGKVVKAYVCDDFEKTLGVNDRIDLAKAQKIKNKEIVTRNLINGVTIIDPDNTYIDEDVVIGKDTIIYPNCVLRGNTIIGERCEVGPNSTIENTTIGNDVKIINSVANEAFVGDNSTVGPFAYLRPKANIGKKVKIGDFVEIKNSNIDEGTKVSHLTYIGDSDVGKNINFGCGTITVNYDGKNKFRTVIEDNAFIGCNTNLVAPVKIEENAFIAAGSTITDDVEKDSLAIARCRQTIKKDWRKNKQK